MLLQKCFDIIVLNAWKFFGEVTLFDMKLNEILRISTWLI